MSVKNENGGRYGILKTHEEEYFRCSYLNVWYRIENVYLKLWWEKRAPSSSKNGSNFEVYVFWIANIEHFGTSDTLLITDSFLESIVDFRICGDHKELLPEVLNNFV